MNKNASILEKYPIKTVEDLDFHVKRFEKYETLVESGDEQYYVDNISNPQVMKESLAQYLYTMSNDYNYPINENSNIYRYINLNEDVDDRLNILNLTDVFVNTHENKEGYTLSNNEYLSPNLYSCVEDYLLKHDYPDKKYPTFDILYVYKRFDGDKLYPVARIKVYAYTLKNFTITVSRVDRDILTEGVTTYPLNVYGVPSLKKYPMPDKEHVLSAIKFFNYAGGKSYEKELSDNINKKIKEFKIDDSEIHMTDRNKFNKYYKPYGMKHEDSIIISLENCASVAPALTSNTTVDNVNTYQYNNSNSLSGMTSRNLKLDNFLDSFYDKDYDINNSNESINLYQLLKENNILNEDVEFLGEGIDFKKIFNKFRNPKQEIKKLENEKKYLKNKYKIDSDNIIKKYSKEFNDIKKAIKDCDLSSKSSRELLSNFLNSKLMWMISDLLETISENIGSVLETFTGDIENEKLKKIVQSLILLVMTTYLNSFAIILSNAILGPIAGMAVAVNIICPVFEEIAKLTAEKYIGEIKGVSTYNIIFNVFEFTNYAMQLTAASIPKLAIFILRTPAVLMHTLNTIIIHKGHKPRTEGDKETGEESLKGDNRVVLATIFIHCLFNAFGTKGVLKLAKPYLVNESDDNISPRLIADIEAECHAFYIAKISSTLKCVEGEIDEDLTCKDIYSAIMNSSHYQSLLGDEANFKNYFKFKVYAFSIKDNVYTPVFAGIISVHILDKINFEWEWLSKEPLYKIDKEEISSIKQEVLNEDNTLEKIAGYLKESVSIDKSTQEFVIKGINFDKFFIRIKELYKHRGIINLFDKQFSWMSQLLWEKEKISKDRMKITNIRVPLFFALEIHKMFLDLYDEYKLPYYKKVADNIYKKTWISNFENKDPQHTKTTGLSKITYTLKEYQLEFVKNYSRLKELYNLEGYILSFEQGLGKTLTSIALAECLGVDQVVIVSPNTPVKDNWGKEIKEYYKEFKDDDDYFHSKVYVYNASGYKYTGTTKFFIVNQEAISKIYRYLDTKKRSMIIVDESQNFRNKDGKRVQELYKLKELLKCRDVLMMSGTPIKFSPDEIIPCLRMIDPYFTEELASRYKKAFNADSEEISRLVKARFNRTIYRRTKKELSLPNKNIDSLYYTVPNEEDYYISTVNKHITELFNQYYDEEKKKIPSLSSSFEYLIRKYSLADSRTTDEYLKYINNKVSNKAQGNIHEKTLELYDNFLKNYIYSNNSLTMEDRKEIERLSKAYIHIRNVAMGKAIGKVLPKAKANCYNDIFDNNIDDIIKLIKNNTKKTIIFTAFLPVAHHIYDKLIGRGIGTVQIVGDTNRNERMNLISHFRENDEIDVLVATTQTVSTGVTLVEANQILFFGTPYRNADFEQACDRIHRIGQTSEVFIRKVLLRSSKKNVTDRIDDILGLSETMVNSIINEDVNNTILNESFNFNNDIMEDTIVNEAYIVKETFGGFKRLELNKQLMERYNTLCPFIKNVTWDDDRHKGCIFLNDKNEPTALLIVEKQGIFKIKEDNTEEEYYKFVVTRLWVDVQYKSNNYEPKLLNIAENTYHATHIINSTDYVSEKLIQYITNSRSYRLTPDKKYYTDVKMLQESFSPSRIVPLVLDVKNEVSTGIWDKKGSNEGVYDKLGLWNPIVRPYKDDRLYRERVECIIMNEDNEILSYINIKECKIPGGGSHKDELLVTQLINECREEVRANINSICYIGCYIHDFSDIHKEKFKGTLNDGVEYAGSYNYLYVAKYDSKYVGDINAKDRDSLLSHATFNNINTFIDVAKNEWKVAVIIYMMTYAKDINARNYFSEIYKRMVIKTNYLTLNIKNSDINQSIQMNDDIVIMNEDYTPVSTSLVIDSKKRKQIENHIYDFFNVIDKTGKNAEKYRAKYAKMNDAQFSKHMISFLNNPKEQFYLEILPNINEPNLKDIKRLADFLDLELDEYIYYRHDGDKDEPVRSAYKVPTGPLRVDRLQQTLSHKNNYSFDISQRNYKTGSLVSSSKVSRITDAESYSLAAIGAEKALEELLGARGDNMDKKMEMYKEISMYGYSYLKNLPDSEGIALKTSKNYLKAAGYNVQF